MRARAGFFRAGDVRGFALRAGFACRFFAVVGFFFAVFPRLAMEITSPLR